MPAQLFTNDHSLRKTFRKAAQISLTLALMVGWSAYMTNLIVHPPKMSAETMAKAAKEATGEQECLMKMGR
jgi:hypothetical protein